MAAETVRAIVDRETWGNTQALLESRRQERDPSKRTRGPVLLRGLVRCGPCECGMQPTFSKKQGKIYRYYLCMKAAKFGADACPIGRVAAGDLEGVVITQLRVLFRSPDRLTRILAGPAEDLTRSVEASPKERNGRRGSEDQRVRRLLAAPRVRAAAACLEDLWDDLFPVERERIVRGLLEGVAVGETGLEIAVRVEGLRSLIRELEGGSNAEASR